MEIRKNDEFELTIEDMSEDGAGIGKQDGYIWFVKDAVIGDRIRARAMKMKKNYGFARLMEVLEASKDRVLPECPVARQCGGCAMLEKAGVAAVMANGMPQIKALADLVTTADCDHDGVAEVFGTLGL